MLDLNPAQKAAVTAPDGPALVLAGAGSGKTRVIVERILWLIAERGIDARNILALTFTNRAAGEMKSRIAARLEVERPASWVGTFHSFGLFLLRREMDKLGRSGTFTVFDDTDQLALMKRLVKELSGAFPQVNPRDAMNYISRLKQDLATPDTAPSQGIDSEATFAELWRRYHAALLKASAVDFDDLLVLTARLLEDHEDVRDKYQRRYRHVLVDEYQDTNRAQYVIARALAGSGGNLFVVGDEDQGVYSWRGADIQNILDYETDFPGAKVYRLEQNYRSTAAILAAANAVVANNTKRLGKTLWTDRKGGDKVSWYEASDADDEAKFVIDTIVKHGFAPKDTAVLYRTNGQSRAFEEAFLRRGMSYAVFGGVRFYARKEIKDLLAYLRLAANPADDESLRRIVNVPARGIGGVTLERIEAMARARSIPLLQALRELEDDSGTAGRTREAAAALAGLLDDLHRQARSMPVASLLGRILDETGYREYVEKSDEADYRSRLEIVDEFVAACAEFDGRNEPGALGVYLQDLALAGDTDSWDEKAPAVTLMTCHSAKGLEFDHVFLAGIEEGFLPHANALDRDESIEEERRLCYVAMTRARKSLVLTSAGTRMVYGERRDRQRSRFLDEIPPGQVQSIRPDEPGRNVVERAAPPRAENEALRIGVRVRHSTFGAGTVMYTSDSGTKLKVRIRFDSGMSRQFLASVAPLQILEGKRR